MKKLLLFAMGAMVSMASFAQEEDVTSYIQNAGFDEDLTFQADGAMKEIVKNSTKIGRSFAWEAADSTIYAHPDGTCDGKPRSDGKWESAVNGFIGRIKGWTLDTNNDYPKCEWVYFGSVPYAIGEQAIPIADNGDTYLAAPAKPEDFSGDDNIGFAYLRAGWGGRATYKQTVKLPCAKYRLEYWSINLNPNATKGKNLSKVTCRKDTWPDETGFNATEWTKHEIEFTPTAEFTMEFGFESEGGSGSNPFLCIDGIKLYKIDDALKSEIFAADLYDLSNEAQQSGIYSLSTYCSNYIYKMEDMLSVDDGDEIVAKIEARIAEITKAIEEAKDLMALQTRIDYILKTTNYPGKEALNAASAKLSEYLTNSYDEDVDVVALILGAKEEMKAAIKDYYMSQVDAATAESPADLTVFVKNPWFINEDAEPMLNDGIWEFPKQFDDEGTGLYEEGKASSPDLNSEGWYIAGVSGGDQRLNWVKGRSCWNAWNNNFTGVVAVAQDVTGLPNGYYTLSADLITQTGCTTDQHVYLKTIADKKVSSAQLTVEGWDESLWTTISMTDAEKILVINGKLTIGAEGTGTNNGSAGWFCATNFNLNFVGKATQEELETAVNTTLATTIEQAKAYATAMHFAADKKALNDTISKYMAATSYDDKIIAIEKINTALEEAEKSEAKYTEYLPDPAPEDISGKTLLWVKALLDGQAVEGKITLDASKPIVQFAYDYVQTWMACDTASYTKFDATVDLLKNYVNTYAPVYEDANTQLNAMKSELAKKELKAVMDEQKANLTAVMNTKEQVDDNVAALKAVMNATNKQETFENDKDATDFTAFIMNPNAEAVDGWTFVMGNGDGNGEKSGQWFDDSATRYFDTYNSGGLKDFMASQLVKGLPNGTYTVGVYARTPALGAYIFTSVAEADTAFVEIPLNYYQTVSDYSGEDTTVVASNTWGPLWEEAKAIYESEEFANLSTEMQTYYENISNANNFEGRGWKHMNIEGIVVTNHELLIGTKTGSGIEGSKTPDAFAGAWYSVGGWTLTRTAKGDDGDWTGPITGIQNAQTMKQVADGIYTLTGVKANQLQRGLNIVVRNGKAMKVMVK
jgi:hypothetical protein